MQLISAANTKHKFRNNNKKKTGAQRREIPLLLITDLTQHTATAATKLKAGTIPLLPLGCTFGHSTEMS